MNHTDILTIYTGSDGEVQELGAREGVSWRRAGQGLVPEDGL
jgi:hypothetical protein